MVPLDTDFLQCITSTLNVIDRFNFASTCTEVRFLLSVFFDDWDKEMAQRYASIIEKEVHGWFCMTEYPSHFFDFEVACFNWKNTKIEYPPVMTIQHGVLDCFAYEHVSMHELDMQYVSEWEDEDVHVTRLHITKAIFSDFKTVRGLPVKSLTWEIPEKDVDMLQPVSRFATDEKVLYLRCYVPVSADICLVNPRFKIEASGELFVDCYNEEDSHVNMEQLRLYIQKPTMTDAMKKRAGA